MRSRGLEEEGGSGGAGKREEGRRGGVGGGRGEGRGRGEEKAKLNAHTSPVTGDTEREKGPFLQRQLGGLNLEENS